MFADRVTPLTYGTIGSSLSTQKPLKDIMMGTTGDWMYNALDEMVLGSPPPDWTADGWSFTPINLNLLPAVSKKQREKRPGDQKSDATLLSSLSNVTLETTAMRARLQCEKVPIEGDSWMGDEIQAIVQGFNSTIKNISATSLNLTEGKLLPKILFENTTYETSTFATPLRVLCCSNETEDSPSAVAYWSFADDKKWWSRQNDQWTGVVPNGTDWPSRFSIKWIAGLSTTTTTTVYTNNQPTVWTPLVFKEVPAIQALDCKPVIEKVQAQVTVARSSAEVLEYKLLGEPQPRTDVWDLAFDIQKPAENENKRAMLPRQATRPKPSETDPIDTTSNFTAKIG